MNSNFVTRVRIVLGVVCVVALVIVSRLYLVQIIEGTAYGIKADKQYGKENATALFDRGSIFFSSKDGVNVSAATLKTGYTISINPKLIKDPNSVYEAVSQYISVDKTSFLEKASHPNDSYEELQKKTDPALGQSINSLKLPGLNATKENWRVYPGDSLSAHTIGLVGLNGGNTITGQYGLEKYYEKILSRSSSSSPANFFAEIFSEIKKSVFQDQNKEGDIITSIEPTAQAYLEKTLSETQRKWDSDSIGGIVMDPKTGSIVAMALRPTFNPNNLKDVKDPSIFSNDLVENSYEMGSIIKPLTIAVGIDSGAITPQFTYDDQGSLNLSGRKISNYDGKARGVIPVQEILSQSLNVGAATVALKTGAPTFAKYFLSFGYGEKTGIDQPNEQKGIVKNLLTQRDVEIATDSYGQGISMTPIQTIRSLASLANGGMLVTPHIVKDIEYSDGTHENPLYPSIHVLKKETASDVTSMLVKVVDTALKKGQVKMERYSIAAKTGTAQIANPAGGGYYSDRYLHSFFGYFPAYNPKFIVFLYHVYPKGAQYASETLTDPFIDLAKFFINYYEIPPDR